MNIKLKSCKLFNGTIYTNELLDISEYGFSEDLQPSIIYPSFNYFSSSTTAIPFLVHMLINM